MRIRTLAYISIAALLHADAAWCQEKGAGELDRWVPSFGFDISLFRNTADGFQQNNLRPPDDGVGTAGPFPGTPSSGDDVLLDPVTGFTAELMTPGIGSILGHSLGHPRLFAHGDVGYAFSSEVTLAKEGSPGELTFPPIPGGGGLSVGGQGTKTTLTLNSLIAGGGLGVAFTTDLFGRRFRLKPSFEYLRERVGAAGLMKHVSGQMVLETFQLERHEERTLHNVGGGLELEMDAVRLGPFMLSLFVNGRVYRLLDDREIDMTAPIGTNRANCSNTSSGTPPAACWDVKLDPDTYSGSAGIRFRFFPAEQ